MRDLIDEDTVLPAVPMWWRTLDPARADVAIDRLGSASMATDWGHRILSDRSLLYDPLSYHYGSVWPLFTGWASVAAYRYGRPHVGYQALMANALLTEPGALGYVTELLSGDFNAPFGRSSHHQIWSEAMVVTPIVRGMLGIEPLDDGRRLRIAPQLPPDWPRATARAVQIGGSRLDVDVSRTPRTVTMRIGPSAETHPLEAKIPALILAPAFPLDAVIERVLVDGKATRPRVLRLGDVQFVEVEVAPPAAGGRCGVSLSRRLRCVRDDADACSWIAQSRHQDSSLACRRRRAAPAPRRPRRAHLRSLPPHVAASRLAERRNTRARPRLGSDCSRYVCWRRRRIHATGSRAGVQVARTFRCRELTMEITARSPAPPLRES